MAKRKKIPYWNDGVTEIEIGHLFKVNNTDKKCKYKDKIYSVSSTTKSGKGIWFTDNRTNNKCTCNLCLEIHRNYRTHIPVLDVKFVGTIEQRKRNKTIDKLLR
jgi:hypothetical protein